MPPIIEPPGDDQDIVSTNIRLPRFRLDDLDSIAEFETAIWHKAGKKKKLSRNEIIQMFLDWACAQYWKEKGPKPEQGDARKTRK